MLGVANPDVDLAVHPFLASPVLHRLRRPSEQVHHLAFSNEFKFLCPELADASIQQASTKQRVYHANSLIEPSFAVPALWFSGRALLDIESQLSTSANSFKSEDGDYKRLSFITREDRTAPSVNGFRGIP